MEMLFFFHGGPLDGRSDMQHELPNRVVVEAHEEGVWVVYQYLPSNGGMWLHDAQIASTVRRH
jgi:hypothetical protein